MSQDTQELQVVEEKISGMRLMLEVVQVTNEEELADVAEKVKQVNQLGKAIRQSMERITKPLQEALNETRSRFLPYEKECKEAEAILKQKAGVYMAAQEELKRKEEEKIAKQLEAGKIKEETAIRKMEAVGETKKTVTTQTGAKLTLKKVKTVVIVNPELVPKEYWEINETKVKKVALAGVEIPGVEIREENQMSR